MTIPFRRFSPYRRTDDSAVGPQRQMFDEAIVHGLDSSRNLSDVLGTSTQRRDGGPKPTPVATY
jgi:hypothetical protein